MISVSDARDRVLDKVSPLDPLEMSVTDAHGCVLAETVTAPEDLPPHPTAAIDGFAIKSEDTISAETTPVSLTIIGETAATRPFAGRVSHGEAVRISAGASLPEGTDAVVHKDDVAVVGSSMAVGHAIGSGRDVRPAGEDIARGDPVMQDGQRVRGMDVGVLAAIGRARVNVRPRARVIAFSLGDDSDPSAETGLARDSSSFALAGMTREAGADPTRPGIVSNTVDVLREKFQSYLPQADVFVTSGSLEDASQAVLRDALEAIGTIDFLTISARPELTIGFGMVQGRPLFALPENPVSVLIAFELFLRPALLKMSGRRTLLRPEVDAALEDGYEHQPGKETYLRVRAWRDESGGWRARLSGRQGPGVVSSLAGANALAVLPQDAGFVQPGGHVRLVLLEPLEGW
jgi:molybdopterin molybdotransferase